MAIFSIAMGMGGELHLHFPALGTIAMTDFVSYVISLPILFSQWSRMGRFMRRSLLWALAWTAAAMLANFFNFVDSKYWLKCVTLASSSWAIMAVSYVLLKDYPKGYMWYLVGAGIGGWIALYYFRNGALESFAISGEMGSFSGLDNLMEKQIYPSVAKGIFWGCVLPFFLWWRKTPIFLVLASAAAGGFWLLFHGGSRSSFGIFCAAAGAGFVVAYGGRAFRRIARHPLVILVVAAFALGALFGGYKMMARSGSLGEGEHQKFEAEFGEGSKGAVKGRAGLDYAFKNALSSYGLGLGWHLRNHSVIANALSCEGFVGFLFWVYFYLQVFWWTYKRMPYAGKNTSFIVLMVLSAVWDVFGSPFGTRHKFFVLMAFIALCRDNKFYGVESVFDEELAWHGDGK